MNCPHCDSKNTGRHSLTSRTVKGIRKRVFLAIAVMHCNDCNKHFRVNLNEHLAPKGSQYTWEAIAKAIDVGDKHDGFHYGEARKDVFNVIGWLPGWK